MIQRTSKLKNLPPIYIVSLEESTDRRINLIKQLKRHNIKDYYFCMYKRFAEYDWKITGLHVDHVSVGDRGPVTSHILTNKYWTESTEHDYVLVAEDDVDLSTIELWNFEWNDFFNSLPEDWGCIQLSVMRENPEDLDFRVKQRLMGDLGCQIYLIKRHYAERMAQLYYRPDGFNFEIPTCIVHITEEEKDWIDLYPIAENLVFEGIGKTYSIPLFSEDLGNTDTTKDICVEGFRVPCRKKLIEKIPDYLF